MEAVFCCCFSREGGERKKKRIEKAKGETESVRKKTSFFLSRVSASNRNREKETSFWLTEGVGGGPVLEHLVRLKPLRDAGGAGLGRDRREQDPRDGRHRDAAVDELGVGEPLEDLRVGAEAERVEAVVAREGAVEVGRGGVSCWRERGLGREGEKKQFFFFFFFRERDKVEGERTTATKKKKSSSGKANEKKGRIFSCGFSSIARANPSPNGF